MTLPSKLDRLDFFLGGDAVGEALSVSLSGERLGREGRVPLAPLLGSGGSRDCCTPGSCLIWTPGWD